MRVTVRGMVMVILRVGWLNGVMRWVRFSPVLVMLV